MGIEWCARWLESNESAKGSDRGVFGDERQRLVGLQGRVKRMVAGLEGDGVIKDVLG
jgi:hypothetical protein